MLDEFASWGRMASVGDLLTKARKKGGVGALGLQTISQVRQSYGRDGAQTLLACLGSWLTLRCGDSETAEFMSANIGDEQVRRYVESTNHERQKSSAEQIAVERAIMPADLKNLPDLVGVLNIAGQLPAGWVHIPISPLKRTVAGFKIGSDPTPAVADPALTAALPESTPAAPDFVGELLDIGDAPPPVDQSTEAAK
jgi:hypothetical protein